MNRNSNDRIVALEKDVEELALDKKELEEDVHFFKSENKELLLHADSVNSENKSLQSANDSLKSENETLHLKLDELHLYVDEKEEVLQKAKENAPEANFVDHVKSMDSHVKAVTVDTSRFECTFKAKGTPPAETKTKKAKTPFSTRASRVQKTPIQRARPSSTYSRPSSLDSFETII